MPRFGHRLKFLALYAAAALLLSLRVPMILPIEAGEDWRDVWIWNAQLSPKHSPGYLDLGFTDERVSAPTAAPTIAPSAGAATRKPSGVEESLSPKVRWDVFARRQIILLLIGLTIYLAAFPFRKRFVPAFLWFDENPKAGILALYFMIAAVLLLEPPCIDTLRHSYYFREHHSVTFYLPLWDRRQYKIDYGVLLTEQLALAAVAGSAYLIYCAFRGKPPWRD